MAVVQIQSSKYCKFDHVSKLVEKKAWEMFFVIRWSGDTYQSQLLIKFQFCSKIALEANRLHPY